MKTPTPDDLIVIANMAKTVMSYADDPNDIHLEFSQDKRSKYTLIDIMGEIRTTALAHFGVAYNQLSADCDMGWTFTCNTPGWFEVDICANVGPLNDDYLVKGAMYFIDKNMYEDEEDTTREKVRGLRQMAEYVRRRACIASHQQT